VQVGPIANEQAALVKIPPGPSSTPKQPDAAPQAALVPDTPAKSKPAKATKTDRTMPAGANSELFQRIEIHIKAGHITQN